MSLDSFVQRLGPELAALERLLFRMSGEPVTSGSALLLSHRPAIGPKAYAVSLYAPLTKEELDTYAEAEGLVIPSHYKALLRSINGAQIFELSLFGLHASARGQPRLLDRSSHKPLDLVAANRHWRAKYNAASDLFYFGSGTLSENENVGYFIDGIGGVFALRKNGGIWRQWTTFGRFLSDEIERLEELFPAYEAFMAGVARSGR